MVCRPVLFFRFFIMPRTMMPVIKKSVQQGDSASASELIILRDQKIPGALIWDLPAFIGIYLTFTVTFVNTPFCAYT